ncbi:uncharacterized protein DS421_3g84620 [Arachis hypogaea]|nr:uncharacterized protein DS421_3g84620 [Arachis hypogaea]
MAEGEVVAPSANPLPSDCKRKFEDLDSEPTESNAKCNRDDNMSMLQFPMMATTSALALTTT